MCARSASAGWLHLVEQVQEGTEKLKNIKLKKHISLKKKVSGVFCSGVLGEMVTPNDVRRKKEMCGGGKKRLGKDLQRKYPQRSTVKRTDSVRVTCNTE